MRIEVTVPPALLGAFLQHVRAFDAAHPGCHSEIAASAPELTDGQVAAALDALDPPLPVRSVHRRQ